MVGLMDSHSSHSERLLQRRTSAYITKLRSLGKYLKAIE